MSEHTIEDSQRRSRRSVTGRRGPAQRRKKRRAIALWSAVGAVVIVGAVLTGILLIAGGKAMSVRDELTAVAPTVAGIPSKVTAGESEAALSDAQRLASAASRAVAETDDPVWRVAEAVPFVGANFTAVRVAAESSRDLADLAVDAVPRLSLTALRPSNGAFDLAQVHEIADLLDRGVAVTDRASQRVEAISRSQLLPEVREALDTLGAQIAKLNEPLSSLAPIVEVLPPALGDGTPRTYLLMFQGNSELRASGGNPAALALVRVENGQISLTTQATSVQFDNRRPTSITPLDAETEHIYSDIIGRWIPNLTATPHFPTSVDIIRAWWADEGLPPFDDVISTDPVALSYLLRATGPIPLATGETLTSENAVPLLLNEVYFNYGEGRDATAQDLFFASAAASVFTSLTTGIEDPMALFGALRQATEEGRLKIWSADPAITEKLHGSKLAGTLPADNASDTVLGVYFNDTTGAKTDYYADASIVAGIGECTATGEPTFHQTITFADNITPEQAEDLPWFITGPWFEPGTIATDVVLYSPVGGSIDSWTVSGDAGHSLMSQGTHLGRQVVRINVVTTPQTAATIQVSMTGAPGVDVSEYGPLDVWSTPMTRATPLTIDAPQCGN